MCFVRIWEQTAIIFLYNINWLVFITETMCIYCNPNVFTVILVYQTVILFFYPYTRNECSQLNPAVNATYTHRAAFTAYAKIERSCTSITPRFHCAHWTFTFTVPLQGITRLSVPHVSNRSYCTDLKYIILCTPVLQLVMRIPSRSATTATLLDYILHMLYRSFNRKGISGHNAISTRLKQSTPLPDREQRLIRADKWHSLWCIH